MASAARLLRAATARSAFCRLSFSSRSCAACFGLLPRPFLRGLYCFGWCGRTRSTWMRYCTKSSVRCRVRFSISSRRPIEEGRHDDGGSSSRPPCLAYRCVRQRGPQPGNGSMVAASQVEQGRLHRE